MAKQVSLNQLFQGQSGRIGNYVLRIIDGQTYISVRPKKRTRTSDLQKQQMSRFKLAIKWANEHKHDPEFVLAAQQTKRNGINSYNLAIKKALSDPSILDNFTQTISQHDAQSTTSYTTTYTTITPTKSPTKSTPSTRVFTPSLKAFIFSLIILITTTLTTTSQTLNPFPNALPITLPLTPTTEQQKIPSKIEILEARPPRPPLPLSAIPYTSILASTPPELVLAPLYPFETISYSRSIPIIRTILLAL